MYISKKPPNPKKRTANCSIWRSRAQQNLAKISNHPLSKCLHNLIFFYLPTYPGLSKSYVHGWITCIAIQSVVNEFGKFRGHGNFT
jgi:hypothetical protein